MVEFPWDEDEASFAEVEALAIPDGPRSAALVSFLYAAAHWLDDEDVGVVEGYRLALVPPLRLVIAEVASGEVVADVEYAPQADPAAPEETVPSVLGVHVWCPGPWIALIRDTPAPPPVPMDPFTRAMIEVGPCAECGGKPAPVQHPTDPEQAICLDCLRRRQRRPPGQEEEPA